MKINKSELFKTANAIYQSKSVATFAEALRKAWKAANLMLQLAAGETVFQYRKCNGEVRNAKGTLRNMVSDTTTAFNGASMFYFDIEKKGFRSFVIANLI